MNVNFVVKNGIVVTADAVINSTVDTTSNTTGALKVAGGVGITKKVKVGNTATDSRFPNTTVAISNSTSATIESHNIGLLAEGTANPSNSAIYGIGVYGVGYTSGGTRSGGVIGESHVTATTDTGSAIGVRGYSNDTHSGGMNIGLYGDATNGANNYALYLNNGNVYSNYALTWTLNGNLTFAGAYSVTIPTLSLTNALPVTSGGTGVTTKTGTGSVVLSNTPTFVSPVLGNATATTINNLTITQPTNGSTITVLDGKVLTVNNSLTFSGTDLSTVSFGSGGTVAYTSNKLSSFTSTTSLEFAGVISDETGTGSLVFSNTPSLTSPAVTTSLTTGSTSFDLINTTATTVNLAGAATTLNMGSSTGTTTVKNDLVVSGNITFGSGATQLSATVINIDDPLIYLADNNAADILDIGFIGAYNTGVHTHTGLVRDATDKIWKLFSGVTTEPIGNVMDFTGATYDDLTIGGLHATTGAFSSTVTGTRLISTVSTGTAPFTVSSTTPVANLSIGGNAATVTTNANLTGVITSIGNATSVASQSGTGNKFVMDTSPTLVTPVLGDASVTTVNKVTITAPATSATLTLANGSSLITSGANSITLTTTGATNITLPTTGTLVSNTVTTLSSLSSVGTITTGTWSGSFGAVSGANLTGLTAGNLTGTIPAAVLGNSSLYLGNTAVALNKSAGTLTVSGLNTDGYAGALKSATSVVDVSAATAPTIGQVLVATGPSAATWQSLPTGTGTVTNVSGTGTVNGITLSGSVTSTGSLTLGGTLSGVSLTSQVTGTLPVANGGTGVTTSSGTGSIVLTNSPTLVTPTLGAASATSVNKLTLTTPTTGATLTLADNSSLITVGGYSTTLTSTGITSVTLPTSGTLVNSAVTTLSSLSSVGTITTGTWSGSFGVVSGANLTSLTAGNLSGTIPSAVLGNSTHYIGTTAIALNSTSASVSLLTGINIDGYAQSLKSASTTINVSSATAPSANQVLMATSSTAATWQIVSMANVTGTLPVVNGGTGATTLSGVLKGNGTGAFTAATAGTDFVAPSGALGTPSSGTLTNCTGYTFANLASKPTTLSGYGITDAVASSLIGAASGVAPLGSDSKISATYLPSYVDDVLEYTNLAGMPVTGETGKIYVALDTNKIYRWSGSTYIEVSPTAGNADTATKLATARSISASGDATWTVSFDGSANATAALTLASVVTAGTGTKVTYNAKGLITGSSSLTVSDITDIATNYQAKNANLTSIAGLSTVSTGLVKLTNGVASLDTNTYVVINSALGTPSAGTLTNCTGYTYANLSGTVPTWNQNTTGTAAGLSTTLATGSGGTGSTTLTFPSGTASIGYLNIPQVSQSANYTCVLSDSGKHIYHPSADTTARTFTIPANASVAYPIGTAIMFVNDSSAGVVTIAIDTDTLVLAGAGTTGSRSLAANGVATAVKMTSTRWIISGTNLT